jgi:hypothetical protein
LQFPEAAALAGDLQAAAGWTFDPVGPDCQHKTHATILVQSLSVLVTFPHSKRMIQQTLAHTSCYEFLNPDSKFPEEPEKPALSAPA